MKNVKAIFFGLVLASLIVILFSFHSFEEKKIATSVEVDTIQCLGNGDPLATCTCPLPSGACAYVRPTATCYNGTSPICP